MLRYAHSFIPNCDLQVIPRREGSLVSGFDRNIPGGDPDSPTMRHSLVGVYDEIVDNLTDLSLVDVDQPQIGRNVQLASNIGSTERKTYPIRQNLIDSGCPLRASLPWRMSGAAE